MSRVLALFALLLAACGGSQAADISFYAGAGAGLGSSRSELSSNGCPEICIQTLVAIPMETGGDTASDAVFKLLAGARLWRLGGVELTYMDFAESTYSVSFPITQSRTVREADFSAISAYLVGYLPLHPRLDLYAKLGGTRAEISATDRFFQAATSNTPFIAFEHRFDRHTTAFAYAAGAQARVGRLGLRLEYEGHNVDFLDRPDVLSLGATWTF